MRAASGPPSYIISSLTREISQKRPEKETEAMSSHQTNKKMSPMVLLSSQSSGATTPELSPIKNILEFVSDIDTRSRGAESDTSRGGFVRFFFLGFIFCFFRQTRAVIATPPPPTEGKLANYLEDLLRNSSLRNPVNPVLATKIPQQPGPMRTSGPPQSCCPAQRRSLGRPQTPAQELYNLLPRK